MSEFLPISEKLLRRAAVYCIMHTVKGGNKMEVEVKIDAAQSEPKVIIITDKLTDKVQEIIAALENVTAPQVISGLSGDRVKILEQDKIIRIYTEGGKI